jgi:hypothetical protein
MKRTFYFLLVMALAVVVYSCSKDNESDMQQTPGGNNPGSCDTVNMLYATNIAPIIQSNCFGCHSNATVATSGAPFSLEGYNNLKEHVDDGRLIGAITHAAGFTPMPQGGAKLSDCNINKIKAWINRGALNN